MVCQPRNSTVEGVKMFRFSTIGVVGVTLTLGASAVLRHTSGAPDWRSLRGEAVLAESCRISAPAIVPSPVWSLQIRVYVAKAAQNRVIALALFDVGADEPRRSSSFEVDGENAPSQFVIDWRGLALEPGVYVIALFVNGVRCARTEITSA